MMTRIKQALELPNQWFIFATAGTVLLFSTFLLMEVAPVLVFFSMIPMIFSPTLLVITTWKYGLRMGAAVAGATSLFLFMLFHLPVVIFFLMQFAVIGILLGEGLRRKNHLLGLLFTISLVATLLLMAAGGTFLLNVPETLTEIIQKGSETLQLVLEENARRFDLDPEEMLRYQQSANALLAFVKVSFPALLFINAFSIVYLNLLLPLRLSSRLGFDRSHIPPLNEFSVPLFWIWGLIVSGILYLLKVPYLKWAGLNVALVFLMAYLMQGYAILSFYLNRTRLSAILKGTIYLACLLSVPLIVTLCGVGVFDTWFSFRKKPAVEKQ